ncbi:ankyrin [Trichoderma novae-zelandiae]
MTLLLSDLGKKHQGREADLIVCIQKPPIMFFAQGFGGIILKKALVLTPRSVEELNGLSGRIWAMIFVCSIHRWEGEQELQTALGQILASQHRMDNAEALHYSPKLLKVVTDVNYAFYDSKAMFRGHFINFVPSETGFPEATIYRSMGRICHPLENSLELSCGYDEMMDFISGFPSLYKQWDSSPMTTKILNQYFPVALGHGAPQYPFPHLTDDTLEDGPSQNRVAWMQSAGASFRLTRRIDAAHEDPTTIDSCYLSILQSGFRGFAFDFSSSAVQYSSLNVFLWTWLSQLLLRVKVWLLISHRTHTVTPDEIGQHFDVLDKAYRLTDEDLFRVCVCTLKEHIRYRRYPALMVLDNVDTNFAWQASLVKKLHDAFQSSQLRLKVLITSPRIDVIRTSLGIAPQGLQKSTEQGSSTEEACSATSPGLSGIAGRTPEVQPTDDATWYIAESYHPPIRRLRSTIASFTPWLRSLINLWLQDSADHTGIRSIIDEFISCPTEQSAIRAILNSLSVKRPLAESAMTIILWCMRPLKKAEFEVLLNVAMASSTTTESVTFEEVSSLLHGLVIALRGRVSLANDMVRDALQPHRGARGVEWCREETRSHSDLADWCLDYLRLPENEDILSNLDEGDGVLGRDPRHGLLWYAVDHWAEHARRSRGCWSPERQSFQSLLTIDGTRLNLWAVAKSMQQPALPSFAAAPRTPLSILAQHGIHSAVEILINMARGQHAFGDELADAFVVAASGGNLETVRVLAQQVELRRFDVDQAVLAAIESGVEGVLVEVIGHAERLGLEFGDATVFLARAASLNNLVAVQVVQDMILRGMPLDELSKSSFQLGLACYTKKPDMLLTMLGLGISPTPGDTEGWRQPMRTICQFGGSDLVEPFLDQFKSTHNLDTHLWISICRDSLREADEYGQYAVISSTLNWALRNSLVLLDESIISLPTAFWSNMEHAELLMSPFTQPAAFEQGSTLFKQAVFAFFEKGAIEIAQELLVPPITIDEVAFCDLMRISGKKADEKLMKLICSVGARSDIDMSHPLVHDTILADDFIAKSIKGGFIAILLEYKLDPNMEIPSLERSMLGYAAYENKTAVVRALLAAGAKVNAGGDDWTPLHYAYDNPEITELLLENGADVDSRDSSKRSALYFASKWGNIEVVSAILEKKPHRDTLEQALGSALSSSQIHIAELLIEHDNDLTVESSEAGSWLAQAVSASKATLVHLILDRCRGLDFNQLSRDEWPMAPLLDISHSTDVSIIRTLVARGADVNMLNRVKETPLSRAARVGNLSVARCLVRRGAKVNGSENQRLALTEACSSSSPEFVKFLVDEGADVNAVSCANPGTALHAALLRVEDNDERAIQKAQILDHLLDMDGIDVRIRCHYWGSVLNVAAMKCQPAIVTRLLKMGVAANDVDHLGRQPIHFALLQSVEMAQLLLREKGVTLDGEDILGRHALHFAAQSQRLEVVEFVLRERPLLVNKPDIHGWTPLLWAIRPPPPFLAAHDRLKDVLKLLLDGGASKFVKGIGADGEVWTPVRFASYGNMSADVQQLVTPSENELGQRHENDGDIWAAACDRQGKLNTGTWCDICLVVRWPF